MSFRLIALIGLSGVLCSASGRIVARELRSKSFAQSKTGTDPVRKMVVYLPDSYDGSAERYPVIYFMPNSFGSFRDAFDHSDAQGLFDRAIAGGTIGKFLFVSVDMNTPLGSSWYVNSPATGNWDDFVIQELVPDIDRNFRTLANRNSRGIVGDFMGGHGAIRFGMRHPDVFGSVYGLHPVGTGSGVRIMDSIPDWNVMASAKSQDDVKKDGGSTIFTAIFQAFLPNPNKPPLFIDAPASKTDGHLAIDPQLTDRVRRGFFLESLIAECAENLKSLRGFKFDWARSDSNYDHVYANQAFTHKLNEYGIPHEAEEYNGEWTEHSWGEAGRINSEVLPFFRQHLVFVKPQI